MLIFRYILFFFRSIHLHGVHSPFVFQLINRCLRSENMICKESFYNEPKGISHKQLQLLLKIIQYFDIKLMYTTDEEIAKFVKLANRGISVVTKDILGVDKTYDLIFINEVAENVLVTSFLENMHNNSVLVINDIHLRENQSHWQQLINHHCTTACIDVFTQGYVFVRREQKKEVFFVRV